MKPDVNDFLVMEVDRKGDGEFRTEVYPIQYLYEKSDGDLGFLGEAQCGAFAMESRFKDLAWWTNGYPMGWNQNLKAFSAPCPELIVKVQCIYGKTFFERYPILQASDGLHVFNPDLRIWAKVPPDWPRWRDE